MGPLGPRVSYGFFFLSLVLKVTILYIILFSGFWRTVNCRSFLKAWDLCYVLTLNNSLVGLKYVSDNVAHLRYIAVGNLLILDWLI